MQVDLKFVTTLSTKSSKAPIAVKMFLRRLTEIRNDIATVHLIILGAFESPSFVRSLRQLRLERERGQWEKWGVGGDWLRPMTEWGWGWEGGRECGGRGGGGTHRTWFARRTDRTVCSRRCEPSTWC